MRAPFVHPAQQSYARREEEKRRGREQVFEKGRRGGESGRPPEKAAFGRRGREGGRAHAKEESGEEKKGERRKEGGKVGGRKGVCVRERREEEEEEEDGKGKGKIVCFFSFFLPSLGLFPDVPFFFLGVAGCWAVIRALCGVAGGRGRWTDERCLFGLLSMLGLLSSSSSFSFRCIPLFHRREWVARIRAPTARLSLRLFVSGGRGGGE